MRTIEEKNIMIAEFMGIKFKDDNEYINELKEMRQNGIYFEQGYMTSELKFHTSWDWLMPVVEEIECTPIDDTDNLDNFFNVVIEVFECNINGNNATICERGHTKLEATYKAVVQFIEFYNKQT